jgi:hypothetical protein
LQEPTTFHVERHSSEEARRQGDSSQRARAFRSAPLCFFRQRGSAKRRR